MNRVSRRLLVTFALMSTMLVTGLGPASPTLAVCYGTGNPANSDAGWGLEGAQSGTCDALNDYNGFFQDRSSDGYRVLIRTRYINGSSSWVASGLTDGLNTNYYYSYTDSTGTASSTEKKICKRSIANGSEICANQGVNYGF